MLRVRRPPAPASALCISTPAVEVCSLLRLLITEGTSSPTGCAAEIGGVILGYIEDGPDLAVLAMNGWDERDPSWWLNLQGHPDVFGARRQHRRTTKTPQPR
jgi:hypothetical protein